jgi:hypothetical protein
MAALSSHSIHRPATVVAAVVLIAAGCTSAATPSPVVSPSIAVAPATPSPTPEPVPSTTPAPSPSAASSAAPSVLPAVALAPAGSWTSIRWQPLGKVVPLGPGEVTVSGWSGGYVALEQSPGSDENGNELPVTIHASSSTDGVHWSAPTTVPAGFKGNIAIESIVEGPTGLLALAYPYGDTCGGPESVAAMWTSKDGRSWQRLPVTKSFPSGSVQTIAGGDAGFIALGTHGTGDDQALWTSQDGRTWTPRKLPTVTSGTLALDAAESFADGFVLLGSVLGEGGCGGPGHVRPAVWFSRDGASWTRSSLPGASTDPNAGLQIRPLLGRLFVTQSVPGNDTTLNGWTSTDGRTWSPTAPVPHDIYFDTKDDATHAITIIYGDSGGPPSVYGLDANGQGVTLAETGDGPVQTDDSMSTTSAIGPTGLVVLQEDAGRTWLGIPS